MGDGESILALLKLEANNKYKEVDEKNKILLDCLEEHDIEEVENLNTGKKFQLQEKEEKFGILEA